MTTVELEKIGAEELARVQLYAQKVKDDANNKELAAHKLGVSPAMMYEIVRGNWPKIALKVFEQMQRLAGFRKDWQMVETSNYVKIRGSVRMTQQEQSMYALIGETGTGKSGAAEDIVSKTDNAYYVLADATMSQKGFCDAILNALGVRDAYNYRGIEAKVNAIVTRLLSINQPLLVLDDAGKLRMNCVKYIQIIYDRTTAKNRAGILLIGTETLYEMVVKNAETNKFHMRELYGRIGDWSVLSYPQRGDIDKICHANGITDGSAIAWLSNSTASLHTLKNMVEKAKLIAQKMGSKDITAAFFADINKGKLWKDTHFQNFEERLKKRA